MTLRDLIQRAEKALGILPKPPTAEEVAARDKAHRLRIVSHVMSQDRGHCLEPHELSGNRDLAIGNYLTAEDLARRREEVLAYDFSDPKPLYQKAIERIKIYLP